MKRHLLNRLLSLVLAAVMVLGLFPNASAASQGLRWKKTDVDISWDGSDRLIPDEIHGMMDHKPTDLVRAAIVLEGAPTLRAGYSTAGIGSNAEAMAYDRNLKMIQNEMEARITTQALGGSKLDVVWNLTLAANIISANVPYGKLDAIRAVDGVLDVVLENRYEVQSVTQVSPHMSNAADMVGSTNVWKMGLTGAGSRIAIIDTGTDTNHQSFDNGAYLYALEQNAAARNMDTTAYIDSLELLDPAEIAGVLKQLNIYDRVGKNDASAYFISEKLPFGANYVDHDLNVTHDHDSMGSHGSHVAGIAAANRFIPDNGGYASAEDTVGMNGIAPDAQIITMKVFGQVGGPTDSDYFAAIEDAIWLGCDSVNLSLGGITSGFSQNRTFANLLDFLTTTDTVVTMSAGNSGYWGKQTSGGYLYHDDVSFHTNTEPGSYTNPLTVASVEKDYTMSGFSSWGVPGSLVLKPEITAPGGNIYSINGVDTSGKAYEAASGTSMAAPQVSGMAALVAEYIRDQGLDAKTGRSVRYLTQSLLMSTAVPVRNTGTGGYYSILSQGAGLARVDLAVSAESYVTVDGQADGKVKAELGEDARRSGAYSFTFRIHNLNGRDMRYKLSADAFTQDLFAGGDGIMYLDTATAALGTKASFRANGVELATGFEDFVCDLNGDGMTDAADADYLLEYLVGNETALKADGDVSGDGKINSYDAHMLLNGLYGDNCVFVPADGSVEIDVTLELTESARAHLDAYYPNGAYIEAYVMAEPLQDAEGRGGVTHSIPVLGYYGSWTEPSMFDVGSYLEYLGGTEIRKPYLYQMNGYRSNYVTVDYGNGKDQLFGGNPIMEEAEYLPQRNAFNNKNKSTLMELRYTLIRNAAAVKLVLEDADTGEVHISEESGRFYGAYYNGSSGQWYQNEERVSLGLDLQGMAEGTRLRLSMICAPELYCTYDDEGKVTVNWEKLGAGAYLTTPFTIDNTAPRIKNVELGEDSTLKITAQDNEYIAAVALLNPAGTEALAQAPANQKERGVEHTCELDLHGVFGKRFLVAVYDYAKNKSVYEVTLELDNERPYYTAVDRSGNTARYVGMYETGDDIVTLADASGRSLPRTVAYVQGAVFEITEDNRLYAGFDDDLADMEYLADLDPTNAWKIERFHDLAYNMEDRKLYGLFYSERNDIEAPYLCTIDLYTGQMEVLGEMPIDANSLAIDGEGNFYSSIYGRSELYTYRSDVLSTKRVTYAGRLDGYNTTKINTMTWDHKAEALLWMFNTDKGSTLLKIDPDTAKTELIDTYDFASGGLYIAYEPEEPLFAPSDSVLSVVMAASADTMVGNMVQLTAQILPWNVRDESVTWTSSNEAVATVDENGLVLGTGAGEAVITATSVVDPSKTVSCTVTVTSIDKELKCVVWDDNYEVWWSSFHTDTIPDYRKISKTTLPVNATMMADGVLYASTLDVNTGLSELYTVDPDSFEMKKVGNADIGYVDLAYSPSMDCGMAVYAGYVMLVDLKTGNYTGVWQWNEYKTRDLVGITYCGTKYNAYYGANQDTFLILDADGNVYQETWIFAEGRPGYFNGPERGYVTNIGDPVDCGRFQGFHYDGEYVYWSRLNEADDRVELRVWDRDGTGKVYTLGCFPDGVCPVAGLYTDSQTESSKWIEDEALTTAAIKPATLMTAIPRQSGNETVTPMSTSEREKSLIHVDVTLPADGTNADMTVSYDTDKLELAGVSGSAPAFAWRAEDGAVRLSLAEANVITAANVVARLTFCIIGKGETSVTIATEWLGAAVCKQEEILALELEKPHEHTPGGAVQENEVPATCTADGSYDSVVYCSGCGEQISRKTVTVPATGHSYKDGICKICKDEMTSDFRDVPAGAFYFDPVAWAVGKGITNGTDAGLFDPNGQCMRAVVVTFLWRAAGEPKAVNTANPFQDVDKDDFYYDAVLWAVEQGITQGMDETHFGPTVYCNRAQVVTFLWRAQGEPESSATVDFTDVKPGKFYSDAVAWAVENEITIGMGGGKFGVDAICNRAQVVTFLYRTLVNPQ